MSPKQPRCPDMINESLASSAGTNRSSEHTLKDSTSTPAYGSIEPPRIQNDAEAKAPLINPLAFHTYDWVPGPKSQIGELQAVLSV
ncbi:hypothetical protein N0V84_002776 [Fusarium piperis]|uniref:Uncharacterized protein n=1 Tax=Fusarium piperis TaxID=1435070 RepID=A0A9W9BRE9_9HYPO|nr:hypothetical protein N0V84_002776 [Fusarium piperis]